LVLIQKFIIFTKDSNSKILRIRRIINIQWDSMCNNSSFKLFDYDTAEIFLSIFDKFEVWKYKKVILDDTNVFESTLNRRFYEILDNDLNTIKIIKSIWMI
jgi:hypothetical protein